MIKLKDIFGEGAFAVDEFEPSNAKGFFAKANSGKRPPPAVVRCMEFRRIEALPRRVLDIGGFQDLSPLFRREGSTASLFPIQNACLMEAAEMNGGFFPVPCGGGKTLITLLLPTVLDSENTVLLLPTRLRDKTLREIDSFYSKHFVLPIDVITIVTYEELSQAKNTDLLDRLNPDLVVADECHRIRHASSARTKRLKGFAKSHPATRFVFLSGTPMGRSLNHFAHLIEFALRKNSPLPNDYRTVQNWAGALDVAPTRVIAPGALKRFCEPGEEVRAGFKRRLIESRGVVASADSQLGTALVFERVTVEIPEAVKALLEEVKFNWSIEGDEFQDILTQVRVLRQIACGFYTRWVWPNDQKDHEWLELRSGWHKAIREKLKQSRQGLDSPLLCRLAAERSRKDALGLWEGKAGEGARWDNGVAPLSAWLTVAGRPAPPTEVVWVDDFLIRDAIRRANETKDTEAPCIVWYMHRAVGEKLGELSGWTVYGEGADATDSREQTIIASVYTQREGMNLQHFSRNIYTSLPSSGELVEQSISRTHRTGQLADEVTAEWYGHTFETSSAMDRVLAECRYKLECSDVPQRPLYATHVNFDIHGSKERFDALNHFTLDNQDEDQTEQET